MRACIICGHPERREIERRAKAGESFRSLRKAFNLSLGGIHRHFQNHVERKQSGTSMPFYYKKPVGGVLCGSPIIGCEFWRASNFVSAERILEAVMLAVTETNKPCQTYGYSEREGRLLIGGGKKAKESVKRQDEYVNTRLITFENLSILEDKLW